MFYLIHESPADSIATAAQARLAKLASRRADSKRLTMTRRAARRAKSARLFLALAFGPDVAELAY